MNKLDFDSLNNLFFFLNLNESLLLIKSNKNLYNNKNIIINKLICKELKINNYNNLIKLITNLNNYNIFLDKLLLNNNIVINNYLNLNNNTRISYIFRNYYILIKNIKKIKNIETLLLLKKMIYPIFKESFLYILRHYNSNHIIYFDILKYKQKNNQVEMYINYNNTFYNYQKFNLVYLYLSLSKYI